MGVTAEIVTLAAPSGTWLPSLGGTATYAVQEGTWARVGPLVVVRGSLVVTVIGTGSASVITGLPFAVAGAAQGSLWIFAAAATPLVSAGVYAHDGLRQLTAIGYTAAGTAAGTLAVFTSGTNMVFSLTYLTTDP
jgi:hypothetical protein